jgi:hypothetical protein
MPHAEGQKDKGNADNRKAKSNRNTTYELQAADYDAKYAAKEEEKSSILAGLGQKIPSRRRAGGNKRPRYNGPYDANIALEVLHFRAQGMNAFQISCKPGMPGQTTLYLWRQDNPAFDDLWRQAYDDWLEGQTEYTIQIADKAWRQEALQAEKAGKSLHPYYHTGLYNAVKSRQWLASKRMASKYGEHVTSGEQVILQPTEVDVITGDQGPEAREAAERYRQEQAELRDADAAKQIEVKK